MMPTTPSGTRTRSIKSPFGRVQRASTAPTGSARSATASKPVATASMRCGSSSRRSRNAALTSASRASLRSRSLASRMAAVCPLISRPAAMSAAFFASLLACAKVLVASRAARPMARMAAPTSLNVSGLRWVDKGVASTTAALRLALSGAAENHVIAMDQGGAPLVAKDGGDLAAFLADDAHGVGPSVGAEPAADLASAGVANGDGVAALECAVHARHAGWQQAFAGQQRLHRAGVDVNDPLGLELAGDPTLARRHRIGGGQKPGAGCAAAERAQGMLDRARGDHHIGARGQRDLGRLDFGNHAPARQLAADAARHRLDLGRNLANLRQQV